MPVSAPQPLNDEHQLDGFECSHASLTDWLVRRARQNHKSGGSRCFVVCDGQAVVGYYALAAGSVTHAEAVSKVKRNMPDPVPAIVLGRLAVHKDWMGQGIGKGLLKDAVLRSIRSSELIGVRVMLCHAIDEGAKKFYLKHGFLASPVNDMTVMLPLSLQLPES